jgi:hypothetical protein
MTTTMLDVATTKYDYALQLWFYRYIVSENISPWKNERVQVLKSMSKNVRKQSAFMDLKFGKLTLFHKLRNEFSYTI